MSLGQVAQGDISRTAIYFVEVGKAKPSMETLQLIAARTKKPMDFFLGEAGPSDETALAEVERLLAIGDNAAVIAAGEALVARTADRRVIANARLTISTALVRLGRGLEARSQASAARSYFEETGDVLMAAESLGWEAAGARMMDDAVSVELATEALKRCRSLDPVPVGTEAKLLAMLGHVLVARHEFKRAIEVYEEATSVGASFLDLRRLSYIYGNLSVAYERLGHYAHAGHYLRKAMTILETLQDAVQLAISENNLAILILRQGDPAAALRHAQAALREIDRLGFETLKANFLTTLTEIEVTLSEFELAAHYTRAAIDVAERLGQLSNVGEGHYWLGRIAELRHDAATADAEFAIAFRKFEEGNASEWAARSHATYAEIFEARGDLSAANRELRLALGAIEPRKAAFTAIA